MHPAIAKRAFIPYSLLDHKTVRGVVRDLRYTEVTADRVAYILGNVQADVEDDYEPDEYSYQQTKEPRKITVNECVQVPGGISIPRAYAVKRFPDIRFRDNTVFPRYGKKYPGTITPRDQRQELFFEQLLSEAEKPGPVDILANAPTGTGKSIAAIFMGWQLDTPTLIVVDRNSIASGWLKNFRKLFGQGWTERNVGRVQQDQCDFEGKAFVIAMVHSLASRKYPRSLYNAFGLAVVDEVQSFGGPQFAPTLHMFSARVRAYFTATNRKGAFGRRIKAHTGEPCVVSNQQALQPNAWLLTNTIESAPVMGSDGAITTWLSRQSERNDKIAMLVKSRGHDRDRNVLVLSDRTQQLLYLFDKCKELGVPENVMGIHAGTYQTDNYVIYYKYEGSSKNNRLAVVPGYSIGRTVIRHITDGDYSDITEFPAALYNRLQAGDNIEFVLKRERFSPSDADLDNIRASCQIIFATYGIFSKGVDVPRLDMGVEALPAGNITQPLGRVLRLSDGKAIPEWYAIHDKVEVPTLPSGFKQVSPMEGVLNKFFEGKTSARMAALKRANARVKIQ